MSRLDISLREALGRLERMAQAEADWMELNTDEDGEPTVDWRHWDEVRADFAFSIAEAGLNVAMLLRKLIGDDE